MKEIIHYIRQISTGTLWQQWGYAGGKWAESISLVNKGNKTLPLWVVVIKPSHDYTGTRIEIPRHDCEIKFIRVEIENNNDDDGDQDE